jgi:hypothetical protein
MIYYGEPIAYESLEFDSPVGKEEWIKVFAGIAKEWIQQSPENVIFNDANGLELFQCLDTTFNGKPLVEYCVEDAEGYYKLDTDLTRLIKILLDGWDAAE